MTRTQRFRALVAGLLLAGGVLAFPTSALAQRAAPSDVRIRMDIQYTVAGGVPLHLDAYLPASSDGPAPAIVMVHGGGWVEGDKTWLRHQSILLAQDGYAAFSIDYRLAPQFHYPAPVKDTEAAVRWVRDHASEYDVDPGRVGILGTSAGGTLALLVGELDGQGSQGTQVAAVAAWSPGLDLVTILQQAPNEPEIQTRVPLFAGLPAGASVDSSSARELLQTASPYYQLSKDTPPVFLAIAMHEFIPFEQGPEFVDKLDSMDIPHQFLTPPRGHAVKYTRLAIGPTSAFFDQHVKNYVAEEPGPPTTTDSPRADEPVLDPSGSSDSGRVLLFGVLAIIAVVVAGVLGMLIGRRR